jgi:hypothetical protein
MAQGNGIRIADARRSLVERVSASSYFNRSARLRDLLHYLTERVLEDESCEIREHEVGHKVFGRPSDYDTAADNIVRVHASMLRKRLEQFFAAEGSEEPWVIEIPKGNYAPVFHARQKAPPEPATPEPATPEPTTPEFAPPNAPVVEAPVAGVPVRRDPVEERASAWLLWTLASAAILFAGLALWLLARGSPSTREAAARPAVQQFWSHIFSANRPTDIVLDDAAVALYQELTGKPILLSEYFDRSYLRGLPGAAADSRELNLDPQAASTMVLRRQSSFSSSSFYWKLTQMPESAHWHTLLRFARDYSFRDLKSNNSILIGNSRTNPWVQPFETRMGIRWQYDKAGGTYYPVDSRSNMKSYRTGGDTHEGFCSIALLPNLGGTGNVLIVSGTGGSALNAAADFLADESAIQALEAKAGAGPYFEALIRLTGRSTLPRDASLVIVRQL